MTDELKEAIAEQLEIAADKLTCEKVLTDIEAWDSVAALTIMIMVGDEMGVPVMPNEIKSLVTYGDIEKLVAKKKQQAEAVVKEA